MNKTHRILWLTPTLEGRGVTVVCKQAAKALAATQEIDIHLAAVHELPKSFTPPPNVTLHDLHLPRDDHKTACTKLNEWLMQLKPDVVFFNDTPAIEPYWPYVPGNIKTIGVLHDFAYGWRHPFIEHQHSLNGIVTVSPFVMSVLEKHLKKYHGVLEVIENGTEYPAAGGKPLHKNDAPLRLAFFGAITRIKGAFDLPGIMNECHKLGIRPKLDIIGGDNQELRKIFLKNNLQDSVLWHGWLPREQCFDVLNQCDIMQVLSRSESFGLTTIEAMAMECVPIGYNEGGTRDIITHNTSGFLVPLCDFKEVARCIQRLDKDRAMLEKMSYAAKQRARNVFSASAMAQRYAEVIQKTLDSDHEPIRKDFGYFHVPKMKHRRYAALVPSGTRAQISRIIARFPKLDNYLRAFHGH